MEKNRLEIIIERFYERFLPDSKKGELSTDSTVGSLLIANFIAEQITSLLEEVEGEVEKMIEHNKKFPLYEKGEGYQIDVTGGCDFACEKILQILKSKRN